MLCKSIKNRRKGDNKINKQMKLNRDRVEAIHMTMRQAWQKYRNLEKMRNEAYVCTLYLNWKRKHSMS